MACSSKKVLESIAASGRQFIAIRASLLEELAAGVDLTDGSNESAAIKNTIAVIGGTNHIVRIANCTARKLLGDTVKPVVSDEVSPKSVEASEPEPEHKTPRESRLIRE